MGLSIPIFIGYDPRERAATNVLIDSLYQHSSLPLSITPLVTSQLESISLYKRKKEAKTSKRRTKKKEEAIPAEEIADDGF